MTHVEILDTARDRSGINILILRGAVIEHGFPAQSWLTLRQALSLGGNVRKGAHGTTVVYADRFVPEDGKRRARETGEEAAAIPAGLHQFVGSERRGGRPAEADDLLSMGVKHGHQIARRRGGLFGCLREAGQEEFHTGLPRPSLADLLEEPVIVVAAGFQEQANIEDRLAIL